MTSSVIEAGDGLTLTMPALWRRQVHQQADRLLLACDDARLTYVEAEVRSRRLARGLLAAGAAKGSHVALLYPNSPEFIVGMLAAARIGAVVLPLSTLSTAEELRWLLKYSDTAFLLAAAEFRAHRYRDLLRAALPELDFSRSPPLRSGTAPWLRRIWFSGERPQGHDAGWSVGELEESASAIDEKYLEAIERRVSAADRFVMIHTSGSTAAPKGVIHTHGALIRHHDNINEIRRLTSADVMFSTAPWFWIAGFAYTLLGGIVAGASLVYSNATAASDVLDLLERERPTITNGFAASVMRLAADPTFENRDLSSIRRGGLYPILAPEARPRDFDLRHIVYGMTEVGGALTGGDERDLPEHQRGAMGSILPGFEVKLLDPESGQPCGRGEVGELWIRGPFVMEGYYGKPRSEVFEGDGWWRSGDLGTFDADGFFYFKGRLGDMIKTSGANVSPREVEAVLRDLTGEPQCFVLGLPDAHRGQVVVAIIVADGALDEEALKRQLAGKLSSYKVPRRIYRLSQAELPVLPNTKINMPKLKALILERS
jgi:acyl-CoA synthetase (AMP-forming)/AMP-acid ligase II